MGPRAGQAEKEEEEEGAQSFLSILLSPLRSPLEIWTFFPRAPRRWQSCSVSGCFLRLLDSGYMYMRLTWRLLDYFLIFYVKVVLESRGHACHFGTRCSHLGDWTFFCVPLSLAACPVFVSPWEHKNLDCSGNRLLEFFLYSRMLDSTPNTCSHVSPSARLTIPCIFLREGGPRILRSILGVFASPEEYKNFWISWEMTS